MRTRIAIAFSLALGLAIAGPATQSGAAGTVTITGTSRSGDILTVTGSATFDDQAFVSMGTDAADDATTPAPAGQDLTGAAIRTKANGSVEFQWNVSMLPPAANGVPTLFYGWTFCTDEENCFELDAGRFYTTPADTAPSGLLWRCADATCDIASQTDSGIPVSVTMTGAPAGPGTIVATVSGSAIGATAGKLITPVQLSPYGAAFTGIFDSYATLQVILDVGDGVDVQNDYTVPAKAVSAAVGATGQDPAAVAYGASVTPSGTGAYSASANVAGLTAEQGLYVRACFANSCAYATGTVTL